MLVLLADTTAPNFKKKTFTNSHKISKFANIFSLKSFSYRLSRRVVGAILDYKLGGSEGHLQSIE